MKRSPRHCSRAGNTMVEFLFVALLLLIVLFAGIEFDRMLFVYSNLADAAKAGVRYATVRGANRTTGSLGSTDTTEIEARVKDTVLGVDKTRLTVTVTYPDGGNNLIGNRIGILVSYSYDPWVRLPLSGLTLRATSKGVITW